MDDLATIADRYRRRADTFEAVVAQVVPDRWDWPSPCEEWTTRGVLDHVVDMQRVVLRGTAFEAGDEPTPGDPAGAFAAVRARVEAALADPVEAERVVETPGGPMAVAAHVDQVASADLVVHTWDLARAAGLDHAIPDDELDRLWPGVTQIPAEMRIPDHFGPGIVVFGPEVEVPDDAPVQDRVLGCMGRDPGFVPGGAERPR